MLLVSQTSPEREIQIFQPDILVGIISIFRGWETLFILALQQMKALMNTAEFLILGIEILPQKDR
jgi:hypothetical protein